MKFGFTTRSPCEVHSPSKYPSDTKRPEHTPKSGNTLSTYSTIQWIEVLSFMQQVLPHWNLWHATSTRTPGH